MSPPAKIRSGEWPPGWHVSEVASTGSTNADLLEQAARGAPDRSVLRAGHQTAGRGRLDRRWDAPPGANLLVSMLFRRVPAQPSELTRRVGLAAVEACRIVAGVPAMLKWPNDVLVADGAPGGGRKLAGVLAQQAPDGPVVVGIGLNVGWAPDGAASLGAEHRPADVLAALLTAYDALPDDISASYRAALATLGRRVRVDVPVSATNADGAVHGTAIDVASDGRLVVLDTCGITHRFDVGDVVHLRDSDGLPPG